MKLIKDRTRKSLIKSKTVSQSGIELTAEVLLLDMSAKLLNELLVFNGGKNACLVSYKGEYAKKKLFSKNILIFYSLLNII